MEFPPSQSRHIITVMGCCVAKDASTDEPRRRRNSEDGDSLPPTPTHSHRQPADDFQTIAPPMPEAEVERRLQLSAEDRIQEAMRERRESHDRSLSNPLGDGRQRSTPTAFRNSQSRIRSGDQDFFAVVRNTNPVPTDDPHWRLASSSAGLATSMYQRPSTSGTADGTPAWVNVAIFSGSPAYRTAELDAISATFDQRTPPRRSDHNVEDDADGSERRRRAAPHPSSGGGNISTSFLGMLPSPRLDVVDQPGTYGEEDEEAPALWTLSP